MGKTDALSEAIGRFEGVFAEARKTFAGDPNTFFLATVDASGQPSIRAMTLRTFDQGGFVFATNSGSRKGQQLAKNPKAAINFFWPPLLAQIKIEGLVEVTTDAEADEVWRRRDRDSQLAFWASEQSAPLESRELLRQRFDECKKQFRDVRIPRPESSSCYRLVPHRIEFWESGWHRLHEGLCFTLVGDTWERTLINP